MGDEARSLMDSICQEVFGEDCLTVGCGRTANPGKPSSHLVRAQTLEDVAEDLAAKFDIKTFSKSCHEGFENLGRADDQVKYTIDTGFCSRACLQVGNELRKHVVSHSREIQTLQQTITETETLVQQHYLEIAEITQGIAACGKAGEVMMSFHKQMHMMKYQYLQIVQLQELIQMEKYQGE